MSDEKRAYYQCNGCSYSTDDFGEIQEHADEFWHDYGVGKFQEKTEAKG